MRRQTYIILSFLILALLIQNTCPQGSAGKSTVAASSASCSHCPNKQIHEPVTQGVKLSIKAHPSAHIPMYVLNIQTTKPTFQLAAILSPQPIITNAYKNAAPDELLHPPSV